MATDYFSRGFQSTGVTPFGDQWKKMRRVMVSDVLSAATLQKQHAIRVEEADQLVSIVYNKCKSASAIIDVREVVRCYGGNIFRRLVFGRRCFSPEESVSGKEEARHVEAAFEVLSLIYVLIPSDFIPSLRRFDLNGHERLMRKIIGVVNDYHDPIVEERMRRWREGGKDQVEDVLDILITLKDSDGKPLLTEEEIKAQCAEILYVTLDNATNIVEWTLAEMLNNTDILNKAVEEIDRVVGRDRLVEESDFPHLPFVKACARESLRLHPVFPFNLPHVALDDTEVAGYRIPKGSWVQLSRLGLGRNPKVWDNPLVFDPSRHFSGVAASVELAEPELRFVSFTLGRRGCVGYAQGTLITYMMLARLLQAFDWSLVPGERTVDLSAGRDRLFKAKPLLACAAPRLSPQVLLNGIVN